MACHQLVRLAVTVVVAPLVNLDHSWLFPPVTRMKRNSSRLLNLMRTWTTNLEFVVVVVIDLGQRIKEMCLYSLDPSPPRQNLQKSLDTIERSEKHTHTHFID